MQAEKLLVTNEIKGNRMNEEGKKMQSERRRKGRWKRNSGEGDNQQKVNWYKTERTKDGKKRLRG